MLEVQGINLFNSQIFPFCPQHPQAEKYALKTVQWPTGCLINKSQFEMPNTDETSAQAN